MNNNTKELLSEIQDIAVDAESAISLINGLVEIAYLIDEPEADKNKRLLADIRNGLPGVAKLLNSEVASKLFELDEYTSIKGEIFKAEKA